MNDSQADFKYRNTNRVDVAQIEAEKYFTEKKVYFKNIGFDSKDDKIPSKVWFNVPEQIRCMPDMFIFKDQFIFCEIKGCRSSVKIKIDDLLEYNKWSEIAPVILFIFSTTYHKRYIMRLKSVWDLIEKASIGKYNDNGKIYINIPCSEMSEYSQ